MDRERLTFFVVGCQRCGTTWIDESLREHPGVYLPPQKQSYFFDQNYDKGLSWYLSNFDGVQASHRAVGEVASSYCLGEALLRLRKHFPKVRLIMSVRDPIDRAFSYFSSRERHPGKRWKSFEEAIEREPDILERGRYIEQIETVLDHYERSRFLLLFYDDLVSDAARFLRQIFSFIEVDPTFRSTQIGQRRHSSQFARIRYPLERIGLRPVFRALKRSATADLVRRTVASLQSGSSSRERIEASTRQALREYYRPLNDRLARFAGRDLGHWNA